MFLKKCRLLDEGHFVRDKLYHFSREFFDFYRDEYDFDFGFFYWECDGDDLMVDGEKS